MLATMSHMQDVRGKEKSDAKTMQKAAIQQ